MNLTNQESHELGIVLKKTIPRYKKVFLENNGIFFISDVGELNEKINFILRSEINKIVDINNYEGILARLESKAYKLKPINSKVWILYKKDIDEAFLDDLWQEKNFYDISLYWAGSFAETVKGAYISSQNFSEDLKYYVENEFENKVKDYYVLEAD